MQHVASYHDLVRHDALAFLPEDVGHVLDFGGGIGCTTAALRDSGRAGKAVLFDQVAGDALPQIDVAEALDLEDLAAVAERARRHGPYDTILALDVLEHLRDPWAVIRALEPALKPGGRILVSVPNVSSHVVLVPLLLRNRFEYTASGVLDRTHLRWFTRDSAIALAQSPGLTLEAVRTDPFGRRRGLVNALSFRRLERFLALQWLVMVRKPADANA